MRGALCWANITHPEALKRQWELMGQRGVSRNSIWLILTLESNFDEEKSNFDEEK